MTAKRWTLDEHIRDISDWEGDRGNLFAEADRVFFVAYERWLNDRDLLTLEDGYEWRAALVAPLDQLSPSPRRLLTGPDGFLTRAEAEALG